MTFGACSPGWGGSGHHGSDSATVRPMVPPKPAVGACSDSVTRPSSLGVALPRSRYRRWTGRIWRILPAAPSPTAGPVPLRGTDRGPDPTG